MLKVKPKESLLTSQSIARSKKPAPREESSLSDQISGSSMDRKIERPKWPLKRVAIYTGGVILLALLVYTLVFGDRSSRLNVQLERLTIVTIERGDFQEFIPVNGIVEPIRTIYLSPEVQGRVDTLFLEPGSMVSARDPILRLENANLRVNTMSQESQYLQQLTDLQNYRITIEQARLDMKTRLLDLDYQVNRSKREYEWNEQLYNQSAVSLEEYLITKEEFEYHIARRELLRENYRQDSLRHELDLEQNQETIRRIQLNLDMLRRTLENLVVRAPISGQLTSLDAEIGETKSIGQRLGQIDVLDGFKVRATIDEHYITRITLGLEADFDLAGELYTLAITKVYPEVQGGQFQVDLEFADKVPPDIRRGQTVRMRLALGNLSEAVLLARGGFYQATGGRWAYVVDPSNEVATRRTIELGRQNPLFFEVLDGLEPGERVITSSYDTFGDNDKLILK
ncbi:MAG: HlyD family efflux transporter periplasmic adaptor subunit [Fidelibacterota bacterium]|nr:MAG: HlyD family efflux transporter periplasmic adaptor subunit [Candidatus Neomarinimicrobiota bacterium]